MYRTVVNICTAQWSLYVPYNGHYMYRTVVTVCTVQWSLYVPHIGQYMYRTVVTTYTTSLTFTTLRSAHSLYLCVFVWISEQTAIISLYNINWLVFVTETESVYCAVRTEYQRDASTSILLFDNSPSYCWGQLLQYYGNIFSQWRHQFPKCFLSVCVRDTACHRNASCTALTQFCPSDRSPNSLFGLPYWQNSTMQTWFEVFRALLKTSHLSGLWRRVKC